MTADSKGLVNCAAGVGDFAASAGWDMTMSAPLNPLGGVFSRFFGPPQIGQPFHGPGLDISYGIGKYVVGPAGLGLAGSAGAARSAGGAAVSGTSTRTGKLLFTNRFVGVNSKLLGNSGAGGESGLLNRSGSWLKFGWSSSPKFGGGWHLRLGIGRNPAFPNKARWHGDFRSTRVSNSDAKGLLDLVQGQ